MAVRDLVAYLMHITPCVCGGKSPLPTTQGSDTSELPQFAFSKIIKVPICQPTRLKDERPSDLHILANPRLVRETMDSLITVTRSCVN